MNAENNSLWQRLFLSLGVMLVVAIVCLGGFLVAAGAYLWLAAA